MLALLAQNLDFLTIGILYAVRSLTINLLEIPSGALADGFGRRNTMIGSLVAYIVSFLTFAWAPHPSYLFAAMVLYGIGDSFRTGTHKAMIFEWLRLQGRADERTKIYGITRSWSKFGSALSAILAAVCLLLGGDFRSVFLLATLPYIANVINLIGYPAELDGMVYRESFGSTLRQVARNLRKTISDAWKTASLRRLMAESMAWEGVFGAIKDYLQPVLVAVMVARFLPRSTDGSATVSLEASMTNPYVVALIAGVYTVLFFASGWASRLSHRIVSWCGSQDAAAHWLWKFNFSLFVALLVADLVGGVIVVALCFVLLTVLQNAWRPILISRFDDHGSASQGATVLSIESQAQRLATFAIAPLAGWSVDVVAHRHWAGEFWPLALVGGLAAAFALRLR